MSDIDRRSQTWREVEAWAIARRDEATKKLVSETHTHTEAKDAALRREVALVDELLQLGLEPEITHE